MSLSRKITAALTAATVVGLFGLQVWAEDQSAASQEKAADETPPAAATTVETKPPEENPFPLVVRIDKSALVRYTDSEWHERRPVDKVVLGAHAVGDSLTVGSSYGTLLPKAVDASFDITFEGNTTTTTAARQEPAIIYSRTYTNVRCTSHIVFDPHQGFRVVGETDVSGDTKLIYDGVASTRRFGRRLIERIAMRRAQQSYEAARRVADRDNKHDVRVQFEKEIAKTVESANKNLDLVQYVNRFLGSDSSLQLFAKSSPDCIHICIGPEGEKFAPMTELPQRSGSPAPIEVWVHSSILGEPVNTLFTLTSPAAALPTAMPSKIIDALSFGEKSDDRSIAERVAAIAEPAPDTADHSRTPVEPVAQSPDSLEFSVQDGWLVLALPDDAVAPEPASEPEAQVASDGVATRR